MAVLVNRQYLLMLFLASMYQRSIGQCQTTLPNTILRAGEQLTFSFPTNPECNWWHMPANSFFNRITPVGNLSGVLPDFLGSVSIGLTGLMIPRVSTAPAGNEKWSAAGLYVVLDKKNKCNSSAKVAVIESGPICECNASTRTSPASYSCYTDYSDSPELVMYPQYVLATANDKYSVKIVPLPRRIDKYRFRSVAHIPSRVNGRWEDFKPKRCTLTYAAPPYRRFPSIDKSAPKFSDSCTFKCD